jgi:hypothetical protein
LARIKKIMKSDEVVYADMERDNNAGITSDGPSMNPRFMIAGEAPILLGKACEMLVKELTTRAWKHTERNRRRTLQKQDVYAAVGESEVYDFLIDIVPRVPSIQAAKGAFAPSAPAAQPESTQQIHRTTAAVVNEIPTINHAPPATATQQAAMSQAQLQMQYNNFIYNQQQGLVPGAASATTLHQMSAQQPAQHPVLQQIPVQNAVQDQQILGQQQLQNQQQTQQAQVAQAQAQAQAVHAQAQARVQAVQAQAQAQAAQAQASQPQNMDPQQQTFLQHVQQYQAQGIPLPQDHLTEQQQYVDHNQNRNMTGDL